MAVPWLDCLGVSADQLSVAGHVSWHWGRMVRVCPHRHAKQGGHEQTGFWEWSLAHCELRAMLSNQWEVS